MPEQLTKTSDVGTVFLCDEERDAHLKGLLEAVAYYAEFYANFHNLTHNEDISDRPYRLKVTVTLEPL